jgi:gephyrin
MVDAALGADEAVWVTTGGALPRGADAVVPVEDTAAVDGADIAPGEETRVRILAPVLTNNGVRAAGSDLAAGALIVAAGCALGLGEATTLLSAGITTVGVVGKPTVAVLSTGDELLDPLAAHAAPEPRVGSATSAVDTNRPMLFHVLRGAGYSAPVPATAIGASTAAAAVGAGAGACIDGGICPDNRASLQLALRRAAAVADVVITTGGVSMGDRDYVKPILESWQTLEQADGAGASAAAGAGVKGGAVGSTIHFGRLNMKPGKPATCATVLVPAASPDAPARQVLVFALPGNPVSAWVCAQVLVLPALRYLAGGGLRRWTACLPPRVPVRMLDGVSPDHDRPEYLRAMVWAAPPSTLPAQSGGAAAGGVSTAGVANLAALAGQLFARAVAGSQASSRVASISQSNALLWVPAAAELTSGAAPLGAAAVTYESSDGEKLVALTPPFIVEALLIDPLLHAEALPRELADVTHLRKLQLPAPAPGKASASGSASAEHVHASHGHAASSTAAGGHRHGCRCGMNHELKFASVSGHLQAATGPAAAPAPATSSSGVAVVAPQPASAPVTASGPAASSTAPPGGHALQPASQLQVRACVLTVSDRCASGTAVDKSGPAAVEYLNIAFPPPLAPGAAAIAGAPLPHAKVAITVVGTAVSADDPTSIARVMEGWLNGPDYPHLVLTTGGTGLGPRDVTPEALRPFITRPCHGLQHAMLAASLGHTPMAALSRYEAGIIDHAQCSALGAATKAATAAADDHPRRTLLVEMPGSVKAVVECMDVLAKVLPHALSLVME